MYRISIQTTVKMVWKECSVCSERKSCGTYNYDHEWVCEDCFVEEEEESVCEGCGQVESVECKPDCSYQAKKREEEEEDDEDEDDDDCDDECGPRIQHF